MGNMSIDVTWINGVSLKKHCDQAHGRATFYLTFATAYDDYPSESQEFNFALTPNAPSVAKFNRLVEAIADIFADDSADAPLVEAIASDTFTPLGEVAATVVAGLTPEADVAETLAAE